MIVDIDTEVAGDAPEPAVGTRAEWRGEAGRRDLGRDVLGGQLATEQHLDQWRAAEVAGAHDEDAGRLAHRRSARRGRAGTPTTVSPGATSRTTDGAGADGGPGTDRTTGHDGGADADECTFADVDVTGERDPGRDVGEGADPATVVDGCVGVDDHATFEVGAGVDHRSGHHEDAVVDVSRDRRPRRPG